MPAMTPMQVARDPGARERFQSEVAYRAGRPSDPAVVDYDAQVLRSRSGLLAIAWLWPDQTFAADTDPFELAEAISPQHWRDRLGAQVQHAIRFAARAVVGYGEHESVDDILNYLVWKADLSEGDIVRLGEGKVDQLAVWVRICRCLQLEFDSSWWIADPARLARRIEQARWARGIAHRVKQLPTAKLRDLRLPPQATDPVPRIPREVYHAPSGRYRGLYLELAEDTRESPTYSIDEINTILTRHGESPLPPSATKDTSWWAGRGTKTEGRPQVAAWWAAGYRIADRPWGLDVDRGNLVLLDILSEEGEVTDEKREELSAITSVTFEALPGRREWLGNEERVELGQYRMPDSVLVPLPPLSAPPLVSDYVDDRLLMTHLPPTDVIEWFPEPDHEFDTVSAQLHDTPAADADLFRLVKLIEAAGEMDREQIVRSLLSADVDSFGPDEPDGAHVTVTSREVKSLLTRARRRGLIMNRGTNRKPRWVTVGSTGDLVLGIKQTLDERRSNDEQPTIEVPKVGPGNSLPEGFLAQVATRLGIEAPPRVADAELARAIIDFANDAWHAEVYTSAEGALTREGLEAVSDAIIRVTLGGHAPLLKDRGNA